MFKRPLALAFLSGTGFTALIALFLNIPSTPIAMIAAVCLVPGGIIDLLIPGSSGMGRPAIILAFNAFVYSAIVYVGLIWHLRADARRTKRVTLLMVLPVSALVALACIPKISPIWPRGMNVLKQRETALRLGLAEGMPIESARLFLREQGVEAYESKMNVHGIVLQNAQTEISAEPGDRLISARINTDAGQFPCGYRIDVVLVFGVDGELREKYIGRNAVCP